MIHIHIAGSTSKISSKHNIAIVFNNLRTYTPPLKPENKENQAPIFADFLIQTGTDRFGGSGSRPSATFGIGFFGRGAAYSINIPAAISSARISIISLMSCINCFRKFATRFARVSWNSFSRPWCRPARYSMMRRFLSSAVNDCANAHPRVCAALRSGTPNSAICMTEPPSALYDVQRHSLVTVSFA